MRLPESQRLPMLRTAAVVLVATLCAAACSRLTFIRPDASGGKYEKISPDYDLRDSAATTRRLGVAEHIGMAQSRLLGNDLAGAEKEARAALKSDPGSADAYTLLAVITDRRGNAADAGGYYAKAAELAPTQGAVLNNYGAWLCGNGRAAESLPWFQRALTDQGYRQAASAQGNAGACALRAGQTAGVDANLRAALAADPENANALGAMADYQYRMGAWLDARAFSQRRLAAAPATAEALQLASRIEDKLGDRTAATRYEQRLRTEFPQARATLTGDAQQP